MISLENIPRSPYADNPLPDRLLSEVSDVLSVEVARNVSIGYTLLNRHLIGDASPIVAIGGFMSDLTTPDRAYEGTQLATLQRPVMMLDMPGHGISTPHSSRQVIDLCIKRTADSQAGPLVEAVQQVLNPNDEIDYFGISHGSLLSLKSAEHDPGDRVRTVFGIDIPAVKRRLTLDVQASYMVKDGMKGRKKYLEALKGTEFEQDFEIFKEAFAEYAPERADSFMKNNFGLFVLNLFASINARPVAFDSWKKIMDTKKAKVSVVTSENGGISNPAAIATFIDHLPEDQQERSKQTVIEGEDHNIAIVHLMPRAAAWAKAAYDS
jgi:pimeloyl-ACP methyl ester carboxylesterase